MKILIINQYAGTPEMGMELRHYYLACQLIKMGHSVLIVTGEYSHLRQKNFNVKSGFFSKIKQENIDFFVVKNNKYNKNNPLRAVNVFSFTSLAKLSINAILQDFTPDFVVSSSTHALDFSLGEQIAKKAGAKLIFEMHDIWPLSLIELYGFKKENPFIKLLYAKAKTAVEQSDGVISYVKGYNRYCKEQGLSPKKLYYLPNRTSNPTPQKPPENVVRVIDALNKNCMATVVYAGGANAANCIDDYFDLARSLPYIAFVVVSGDKALKKLKETAPKNIYFLGGLPHRQVFYILQRGDILWLGTKNLSVYGYGISMNKLFDYMAAKRPILLCTNCEDNPVLEYNCGITVAPQEKIKAKEAIKKLLNQPKEKLEFMGENAGEAVEQVFNYSSLCEEFLKVLEDIKGEI